MTIHLWNDGKRLEVLMKLDLSDVPEIDRSFISALIGRLTHTDSDPNTFWRSLPQKVSLVFGSALCIQARGLLKGATDIRIDKLPAGRIKISLIVRNYD